MVDDVTLQSFWKKLASYSHFFDVVKVWTD